jgi:hypothetical protein
LVKFRATSDFGNNLYLDNVNLSQSNPLGTEPLKNNEVSVSIFPNPSNGETNLKINAKTSSEAGITLVNVLGQTVYSRQVLLNGGTNIIPLDVSGLAQGAYSVVIDSKNGASVKKLIVTK